jgi:hypothetical protein
MPSPVPHPTAIVVGDVVLHGEGTVGTMTGELDVACDDASLLVGPVSGVVGASGGLSAGRSPFDMTDNSARTGKTVATTLMALLGLLLMLAFAVVFAQADFFLGFPCV